MRISVEDISLRAGQGKIFEHSSWTLEAGQHWAILGPTGSGKSSLARAIGRGSGLLRGQIRYFLADDAPGEYRPFVYPNEIVTFSTETHRTFLRQFVEYHQARWQSFEGEAAPSVAALLELAQCPPAERERVFALLDIPPLLARRVHQLSHGESRKVFLAQLLLRAPRLLILDDPLAGLDQESRARLQAGIEGLLARPDPAILLVSSRWEEVPAGITHLLLVEHGQITAQGERQSVAASPAFQAILRQPDRAQAADLQSTPDAQALLAQAGQYAAKLAAGGFALGQEVIHMDKVSVSYPGSEVLRAVSWTVRQGERWALTGPNGAGKSTLLSLILADHPQGYRSALRLFGQARGSGESIWEIKRKIGWVSPELQIYYERPLTCFETVCSGFFDSIGLYRQPDDAQQVTAAGWMRAFGLADLAQRPFASLSSGQQRLALLARAMVKHPPLLVMDEPCQGLDSGQRAAFLAMIDQLCRQTPLTLIYVSHDPHEIPAGITHHLRLDDGAVQA
jgi:molybdate transport system ATP-binding protein